MGSGENRPLYKQMADALMLIFDADEDERQTYESGSLNYLQVLDTLGYQVTRKPSRKQGPPFLSRSKSKAKR